MGRDTKFSDKWLEKVCINKDVVSDWCEKVVTDPFSAICRICLKTFSVASMGFVPIDSHAKGVNHKSSMQQLRIRSFFFKWRKVHVLTSVPKTVHQIVQLAWTRLPSPPMLPQQVPVLFRLSEPD